MNADKDVPQINKISQTTNFIMTDMRQKGEDEHRTMKSNTMFLTLLSLYYPEIPPPKTLPCFPFNPSTVQKEGGG